MLRKTIQTEGTVILELDVMLEEKIAKSFIYRNKQDRFLFEMAKRRRLSAICKLPAIVDKSCLLLESQQFPSSVELVKIMQSFDVSDMCYVLSEYGDDGFDGEYVSLIEAVKKLQFNGFPSLIVGLPSGFSHLKYESRASTQPNCFLKPKTRFDGLAWKK